MAERSDAFAQADKFQEAARKHEADEDESAWEKRLRQVVNHV